MSSERLEKQYYLLEPGTAQNIDTKHKELIKIQLLKLPSYLDQGALVLKHSGNKIDIASYHLWANELADSIRNVLLVKLNNISTDTFYVKNCLKCAKLILDIDHFYATDFGKVIFSGYYTMENSHRDVKEKPFFFDEALEEDGYDAAVNKLRELIDQLAEEIRIYTES